MPTPTTQKAIAVVAAGKPVELIERPVPTPGPGEVLVKVSIAGLNPHDFIIREFAYFIGADNLPGTLAIDIVGEIVAVGSSVTSFHVGDTVMGQGDPTVPDAGGSQEYALLDADFACRLPATSGAQAVNADEASTIVLNVLTSYLAVLSSAGLGVPSPLAPAAEREGFDYKGAALVVVGGGSACGKFALQLAKWAGVGTIVTVARKAGGAEAELKALGATHVVDRTLSPEDIYNQVRAATGPDGPSYVLDCVNGFDHTPSIRLLSDSKRGTFVPLASARAKPVEQDKIGPKTQGYEAKRFVCMPKAYRDVCRDFYKALPGLIEEGVLTPSVKGEASYEVVQGLDVDKVNRQLDLWRDGQWPGRLNIHP